MVPTPYQAMLVAREQSHDHLHRAEQERLVRAARDQKRTRGQWLSLASLFSGAMNMASQKRFRLRLNG